MKKNITDQKQKSNLDFNQTCENCSLSNLCLPVGLRTSDMQQLDNVIKQQYIVKQGEKLFKEGDKFAGLYALRSGSIKTYNGTFLGKIQLSKIQISGFYLGGELLGIDGIAATKYHVTAQALETSSVCVVAYNDLLSLASRIPNLQKQLISLLSQKTEHTIPLNSSASERFALFLLNLSARYKRRGYAANHFSLTMPRQDIANYLGIAIETMSRLFSRFQQENIIKVEHRDIMIKNSNLLEKMVCGEIKP